VHFYLNVLEFSLQLFKHKNIVEGFVPVLDRDNQALEYYERTCEKVGENILAFYSSLLGGITKDPKLMNVPMDDHGFHRSYN